MLVSFTLVAIYGMKPIQESKPKKTYNYKIVIAPGNSIKIHNLDETLAIVNELLANGFIKIEKHQPLKESKETPMFFREPQEKIGIESNFENKTITQFDKPDEETLLNIDNWCSLSLEKLKALQEFYDLLEDKNEYETFKKEVIDTLETYKAIYGDSINKPIEKLNNYVNSLPK